MNKNLKCINFQRLGKNNCKNCYEECKIMYQLLKTKETVLDKEQFKNYLTKFAADNVIKRRNKFRDISYT